MTDEVDETKPARRIPRVLLQAVVVLLVIGIGFGLGRLSAPDYPGEASADVGFARSMAMHHAQAVSMADIVRAETSMPEIRSLATDVVLTQQAQIGQMEGWLAAWGRPLSGSDSPMKWMDHTGDMPSLATYEQLEALSKALPSDADREFVNLLIPHHEGGVMMAKEALVRADRPEVKRLAQAIVDSQENELRVLRRLLAELTGPGTPAPASSHDGHAVTP